jgi:hypothetical protein
MRVARVQISKEFFEMFVRAEINQPPGRILTSNAPADLEVLGFASSKESPFVFEALVKSSTFADVAEGGVPPLIPSFEYQVRDQNATVAD